MERETVTPLARASGSGERSAGLYGIAQRQRLCLTTWPVRSQPGAGKLLALPYLIGLLLYSTERWPPTPAPARSDRLPPLPASRLSASQDRG